MCLYSLRNKIEMCVLMPTVCVNWAPPCNDRECSVYTIKKPRLELFAAPWKPKGHCFDRSFIDYNMYINQQDAQNSCD